MSRVHVSRLLRLTGMLTILVAVCLMSCGSESPDPNFLLGKSGRFETQDVERAQKEMDFHIVVPSYLPENLSNLPYISGPSRMLQKHSDNDVRLSELRLRYGAGEYETEGLIEISEWGYPVGMVEILGVEYQTLLIGGIEITQREYNLVYGTNKGVVEHPGYLFYWDQNGVSIHTGIYHYDYDEAFRVVESMIQQDE